MEMDSNDDSNINVTINVSEYFVFSLQVPKDIIAGQLKNSLASLLAAGNIAKDHKNLFYKGQYLSDEKNLEFYNVQNGDEIRFIGGTSGAINVDDILFIGRQTLIESPPSPPECDGDITTPTLAAYAPTCSDFATAVRKLSVRVKDLNASYQLGGIELPQTSEKPLLMSEHLENLLSATKALLTNFLIEVHEGHTDQLDTQLKDVGELLGDIGEITSIFFITPMKKKPEEISETGDLSDQSCNNSGTGPLLKQHEPKDVENLEDKNPFVTLKQMLLCKDLTGMSLNVLQQLENSLDEGLKCVTKKKEVFTSMKNLRSRVGKLNSSYKPQNHEDSLLARDFLDSLFLATKTVLVNFIINVHGRQINQLAFWCKEVGGFLCDLGQVTSTFQITPTNNEETPDAVALGDRSCHSMSVKHMYSDAVAFGDQSSHIMRCKHILSLCENLSGLCSNQVEELESLFNEALEYVKGRQEILQSEQKESRLKVKEPQVDLSQPDNASLLASLPPPSKDSAHFPKLSMENYPKGKKNVAHRK